MKQFASKIVLGVAVLLFAWLVWTGISQIFTPTLDLQVVRAASIWSYLSIVVSGLAVPVLCFFGAQWLGRSFGAGRQALIYLTALGCSALVMANIIAIVGAILSVTVRG